MVLCLALIVAALGLRVYALSLGMAFVAYKWTFCVMDSLAAGAFVALAFADPADRARCLKAAPWFAGAVLLVFALLPESLWIWIETTLMSVLFGSGIALVLKSGDRSWAQKMLSSHLLRSFGKYSYAIYIFHQPIIRLFVNLDINADALNARLSSPVMAIAAINALALVPSLLAGWLSWHLLEKHFLKLKSGQFFLPGFAKRP
jgi:peptidoglycan/LPS O-acetylase OafA/YrhL